MATTKTRTLSMATYSAMVEIINNSGLFLFGPIPIDVEII